MQPVDEYLDEVAYDTEEDAVEMMHAIGDYTARMPYEGRSILSDHRADFYVDPAGVVTTFLPPVHDDALDSARYLLALFGGPFVSEDAPDVYTWRYNFWDASLRADQAEMERRAEHRRALREAKRRAMASVQRHRTQRQNRRERQARYLIARDHLQDALAAFQAQRTDEHREALLAAHNAFERVRPHKKER